MLEFRALLQQAIAKDEVVIPCESKREANNLRQRFYRYREALRKSPVDELNLLIDHIHFELVDNVLTLNYFNPDLKLMENIHDDVRERTKDNRTAQRNNAGEGRQQQSKDN